MARAAEALARVRAGVRRQLVGRGVVLLVVLHPVLVLRGLLVVVLDELLVLLDLVVFELVLLLLLLVEFLLLQLKLWSCSSPVGARSGGGISPTRTRRGRPTWKYW
ncbi:hypothetical protein [Streptomyces tritici]|uniref:hypothetical protein n=1 Tax=Streptomyces tritici TaxID=2054410 RepID=UPI003AF0CAC1